MSVNAFLSFLAGILLIFLIGWILTAPLKTTVKFVLNARHCFVGIKPVISENRFGDSL